MGPDGVATIQPSSEGHINKGFDLDTSGTAPVDDQIKRDTSVVDFTLPNNSTAPRGSIPGSVQGQEKKEKGERSRSLSDGEPYRGMGKEELLRFSNRPFWRNLRYICMSIVLTGWLALLITVVAIVLIYPHCREPHPRDWWQKAVIYRVYVPSFLDSDCDGIGDLQGVRSKLDYLRDLGVTTISLSPIYRLGAGGTGPTDTHIVDHKDVDPIYGTLDDLSTLVNETHDRGMYVTLDFIPNHTSDEHPWFKASSENSRKPWENEFRSYYVWTEGKGAANQLHAPNNWQSVHGCPAWERNINDNEYYLHQFLKSQPDLNLRSQKVKDELQSILKFWLDLGVDGFYIRDSNYLFEDYDLRDESVVFDNLTNMTCQDGEEPPYMAFSHTRTKGLPEVFDMLARWRAYLDDYGDKTGSYKVLLADADDSYLNVMDYYGRFNRDGVDFPLNTFSLDLDKDAGGNEVKKMVNDWLTNMPSGRWANWMGGDDRSPRLADRLGDNLAKLYLMLSMLLPGTPYLYYGDEIGLRESVLTKDASTNTGVPTTDPNAGPPSFSNQHRMMPMRGPMLWSNTTQAGFSDRFCKPAWMPLNSGYTDGMNVQNQRNEPTSLLNLFRNLTSLRQGKPSFEYGDYKPLVQDAQVFSFVREFDGEMGYLVALNFAPEPASKQLYGLHETVPGSAKVEVVCGADAIHIRGGSANLDPLKLMPYEGIVVSWDYKAKEL